MRSLIKRLVMWLYAHRLMPALAVTWLFVVLRLRAE
jgi:hypothetical protein